MKNVIEKIDYPKEGITSKVIEKNGFGDITLFCMGANTSMSEHTSARAGFVYVVEGKGTFTLESETMEMKPGVLISLEANAKHSLKAEEKTTFMLILRRNETPKFSMVKPQ